MNIDRHNYEEYFLLYIDNELNVDQKKQVEAFVSANPDLEEEFVMLQQSRLVADDSIVFEGKELLMKKESGPITIDNYEQWLVLYVDDELTNDEKIAVEKFAESTPTVKAELNLYLQTKLEPQEEIVFPHKEILYRREEKVRVISIRWLRVAAIILFMLASGFGIYSIMNSGNDGKKTTADKITDPSKNSTAAKTVEQNNQPSNVNRQEDPSQKINSQPGSQNPLAIDNKLQKQNTSTREVIAKTEEKNIPSQQPQKEIADFTLPTENTNETGIKTIQPGNPQIAVLTDTDKKLFTDPTVTKSNPETPNDYKDGQTPTGPVAKDDSENRKLRGIFRRATRFIERTTKLNPANDDGKVLIGSMAVSVK